MDDKTALKMQLIAISPVMGFNLTDNAFESQTHLRTDWRTYVPVGLVELWRNLNNYERHVIALTAFAQTPRYTKGVARKAPESTSTE